MPRNGSGTYSLADSVVPATLADANQVMTILNDLASAMTGSIAADGQTAITGQLKGLVSANPVFAFNGDSNTGVGSDTADEVYVMAGGTKIGKFSAAGFNVLSGSLLVAGSQSIPVGTMVPTIDATEPPGWVFCTFGSTASRSIGDGSSGGTARANADTLNLFSKIWANTNIPNGTGQIQDSAGTNTTRGASAAADFAAHKRILLPNTSGHVPRGWGSGGEGFGTVVGADTVTIAQVNLPSVNFAHSGTTVTDTGHNHGTTDPQHNHGVTGGTFGGTAAGALGSGVISAPINAAAAITITNASTNITVNNAQANVSVTAQGSAASGGSGTALNIIPSSIVLLWLIKL